MSGVPVVPACSNKGTKSRAIAPILTPTLKVFSVHVVSVRPRVGSPRSLFESELPVAQSGLKPGFDVVEALGGRVPTWGASPPGFVAAAGIILTLESGNVVSCRNGCK